MIFLIIKSRTLHFNHRINKKKTLKMFNNSHKLWKRYKINYKKQNNKKKKLKMNNKVQIKKQKIQNKMKT